MIAAFLFGSIAARAQHITNQYQNILNEKTYDIIVAESSGEKTKNIAADVASYEVSERDFDNLKESDYFIEKLNEYGLEEVKLNRFPGATAWIASKAVISEVSPKQVKIADYSDIPASACAGSVNTNIKSAQLVWVGMATEGELSGLDLTGKVAFGEASPSVIHEACVAKGAVGVISCYGRGFNEIQIPNISLRAKNPTFAFLITRREGYKLRDRLRRGEVINVSCEIKAENKEFEYQTPSCVIKGTQPELGEVILSAHLFEGYAKLGANDNMSGSAVLLDVARTLNTLIKEGKIERPLRSIRFVWGDEFRGIIPWTNANRDVLDNTLFNLNLDMVGVDLTDHQTTYVLHRNRFSSSHYSSDLAETLMNYVHTTNVKSIILGEFLKPVIAPSGSDDPFHYNTTPYYWASDHSIFCDWSLDIPSIMMITWPDNNYHTSLDRVEYLDATQLKRASVIASALMYAAANAKADEAKKFASMCLGGAQRRLGQLNATILNRLQGSDEASYKAAIENLEAFYLVEKHAIETTTELGLGSKELDEYIAKLNVSLSTQIDAAKQVVLDTYLINNGKELNLKLTSAEKAASRTYYTPTQKVRDGGYGILRTLLGATLDKVSNEKLKEEYLSLYIGDYNNLTAYTNREHLSLLDIKKLANLEDTRGKKIELNDISKYFDILVELGALEKIKK